MENSKSVALDLLRGIAAVAVLLFHVRAASFAVPPDEYGFSIKILLLLTRFGLEGVIVFFVLSGFLVCGQIIRKTKEQRFNIDDYVVDRTTRIFLPLVPACIFTAVINRILFGEPVPLGQLGLNIVGLNGVLSETLRSNDPLWSLAYEIWFYILGGAVAALLSSRRPSVLAFAATACAVAVFCVLSARYLLFWLIGGLVVTQLHSPYRGAMALLGVVVTLH